jgi:hypothetical protein
VHTDVERLLPLIVRGVCVCVCVCSLHRKNFHKSTGGGAPGRSTTMQEQAKREPLPPGTKPHFINPPKSQTATDDLVASRFRARERQRFIRNR